MITIFLSESEAAEDFNVRHKLNDYYDKKLWKLQKNVPLAPIPEPIPCAEHLICAVCEERFDDYLTHITS